MDEVDDALRCAPVMAGIVTGQAVPAVSPVVSRALDPRHGATDGLARFQRIVGGPATLDEV
jgi:hypothetical protein